MHVFALVLVGLAAAPKGYTTRAIAFTIERQADGKKYPNPVKESYSLERDGVLRYGAYFSNMPMEWNHNDSLDWKAGERGKRVLEIATRLANDPASGLVDLPDGTSAPEGGLTYFVDVTRDDADSTRYLQDSKTKAWRELDPALRALVAAFEKETGRPLTPARLPQGEQPPPPPGGGGDVVARAVPLANAALDRAYAAFARKPNVVAPAHKGPWVKAGEAVKDDDDVGGTTVTWKHLPPSGFEIDVEVAVSPDGKLTVTRARASFSPD